MLMDGGMLIIRPSLPPFCLIICRAAICCEKRAIDIHGKICRHCVNGISINADLVIAPALTSTSTRPRRWIRCSMACAPSGNWLRSHEWSRLHNLKPALFFAPRSSNAGDTNIKPFCANNNAHALPIPESDAVYNCDFGSSPDESYTA